MRFKSYGMEKEVRVEGSRISSRTTQPGAGRIMDDIASSRESGHRKSDFMKPMAAIPHLHREILMKKYPDAMRGDKKAMEKFLASSDGRMYRTYKKGGASNRIFTGKSNGR